MKKPKHEPKHEKKPEPKPEKKPEKKPDKAPDKKPESKFAGKTLTLEGDLPSLVMAHPTDTTRVMATDPSKNWPAWVEGALSILRKALATLGIDLGDVVFPTPEDLLHQIIALVEKSPPSWQRFIVLAALEWIHRYVHGDRIVVMLKGVD